MSDGEGFDMDDMVSRLFGGGFGGRGRTRRKQRGSDLRYDMEIELEDAAFGATKTINIPISEKCEKCGGTGAESKSDIVTCHECGGKGTATSTQRTPFGLFQQQQPAESAGGRENTSKTNAKNAAETELCAKTENWRLKFQQAQKQEHN